MQQYKLIIITSTNETTFPCIKIFSQGIELSTYFHKHFQKRKQYFTLMSLKTQQNMNFGNNKNISDIVQQSRLC